MQSLHNRQEGFLCRIRGVGVVASQAPADGIDPVVMPSEKLIERATITRVGGLDQGPIL
jgi:hypothetical protein